MTPESSTGLLVRDLYALCERNRECTLRSFEDRCVPCRAARIVRSVEIGDLTTALMLALKEK